MPKKFVDQLVDFLEKGVRPENGYRHLLFEMNHTRVVDFFSHVISNPTKFHAMTVGQWGKCSIPASVDLASADEMQYFVNHHFEEVKKYGGVNMLIFEKSNPGILAVPTYQDDIVVFLAPDEVGIIENFDDKMKCYPLN